MLTLGIETSCDETSIALLRDTSIVVNEIYTQTIHSEYGGVVPEMASRAHINKIDKLCSHVFTQAQITPCDIDLIAVTDQPGLAGALLVGISFALGFHTGYKTAITGVNHLEGHIFSALLEHPDLPFPFLGMVISGGHSAIYKVEKGGVYTCLGHTVDDAAGEAFDKTGKMLGFAYPAGRSIGEAAEIYAVSGDNKPIAFPIARINTGRLDFSFSGLKTAVKYFIDGKDAAWIAQERPRICYSFQTTIIESLLTNLALAVQQTGIRDIAIVGGVACNLELRKQALARFGTAARFPSPRLCTDNAAMIARAGYAVFADNRCRRPSMNPSSAF